MAHRPFHRNISPEDAALARAMQAGSNNNPSDTWGGYGDDFSRAVIGKSMFPVDTPSGTSNTINPLFLSGLYLGDNQNMINIDPHGEPGGGGGYMRSWKAPWGWVSDDTSHRIGPTLSGGGNTPQAAIGYSEDWIPDKDTAHHEIGGHAGLASAYDEGAMDYAPEGALGRRLDMAMPGTINTDTFLTESERIALFPNYEPLDDKDIKELLGIDSYKSLPDNWEDLLMEQGLMSTGVQMPTVEDWFEMQQRQLQGADRRARGDEGDMILGQNPWTDEHGAVDAYITYLDKQNPEAGFSRGGARDKDWPALRSDSEKRQSMYANEQNIIDRLKMQRDAMELYGYDPQYLSTGRDAGGVLFDKTWTDEQIEDYARTTFIRNAPERAFFGGLSEDIIEDLESRISRSPEHLERQKSFIRDY